jgi:transcriptional regulator with PAS, ATPase and Fis domain
VFLHVNLPDGNSLKELKFFINVTGKKIIIINALDNQEVRNEAVHNEVHDFLNKSFNVWRKVFGYNEQVMDVFLEFYWPGNLREMRNVIRRATLLTDENR